MARTTTFLRSIEFVIFLAVCVAQDPAPIHKKGYCVWYGQCTSDWYRPTNCLYNGPAKNMTDPKGVKLLNSICPELKGQPTCCSTNQLVALDKNLQTIAQLTTRCSACWNNIRRLYCQLACNQDQSLYMDPKTIRNYYTGHEIIIDVNYFVSPTFKQGLFDSCKDVENICGGKVPNFLCGTTVEKCTPQKLLEFMGNTANGFAPLDIHYPRSLAPNMKWMNVTIFKCNVPFVDPQTNKTAGPCSCQDCVASCSHRPPLPQPAPHGMKLDDSKFRKEQLIIKSTHPTSTGYYRYGDGKWIPFGPIFHLELLNQALDLQNHITDMKVPFEGYNITLEDICFQPLAPQTKKCDIQSIFQYFQNNKTKLNKCLTSLGFNCDDPPILDFPAAGFHDHLLRCTSSPPCPLENTLNEPCLGAFGAPIDPSMVVAGFTETDYKNATTLIITYMVNNYQDKSKMAEVQAWEKAFLKYMDVYVNDSSHANLTISYSTPGSVEERYDIEV